MLIRIRCLVALSCFYGYGYKAAATPDSKSCVHIPDAASPPANDVAACESATAYSFDIAGQHYEYAKEPFRQQLRSALGNWAEQSQVTIPQEAWIDFWLAVPDGSPEGTMGRAVVSWKAGGFIAFLGLAPEGWDLASQQIGVLALGDHYPTSFGHQAETLLIKHRDQTDLGELHGYLASLGATAPVPLHRGWEMYHVAAFTESSAAKSIKAGMDGAHHLEAVEVNAMVEWIALRQRVFAFSFAKP